MVIAARPRTAWQATQWLTPNYHGFAACTSEAHVMGDLTHDVCQYSDKSMQLFGGFSREGRAFCGPKHIHYNLHQEVTQVIVIVDFSFRQTETEIYPKFIKRHLTPALFSLS